MPTRKEPTEQEKLNLLNLTKCDLMDAEQAMESAAGHLDRAGYFVDASELRIGVRMVKRFRGEACP